MDNIEQQIAEPSPVSLYHIKHRLILLSLLVAVILGGSGYVLATQIKEHTHPLTQLTPLLALTPAQSVPDSLAKSITPINQQLLVPATTTITLQPTLTATKLKPLLTSTTTSTLVSSRLLTKYLTGSYSSSWSYQSLPEDFFTFPVCLGDSEWNRFSLAGANDVHIDICTIQLTDPETVLETIAPNTDTSGAHQYTPHSAVSSTRFGMQGLKGTWMQGASGTYVPEYFEMYVKNNHMLLISPLQGDNQEFEDLLANIGLNF